ncbi:uncharacterized protein LOC142976312 [Anticarsia gemmatalis]|uniref:uncharacterized protein LOC142976312 n=1 Tax=Anticarsia gemmatalis TaxID=129554 RepID=UPI003F762C3A
MSLKVQKITEPVLLGEGPHWDAHHQALYFVSILDHTINKYVPATGKHTKTKLGGRVGFMVPVEGTTDQFLVGLERKFVIVQWDGGEGSPAPVIKHITEVDQHADKNRINDGKADPRGRVFAGTMGHEEAPGKKFPDKVGSLFRVEGSTVTKVEEDIGISNGLAWDLRQRAFYYTDSVDRKIRRYDYDVDTGHISNMKYIFDFEKHNIVGVPDGTTIDTDGNLWVAVFNGSAVLKIDPRSGELLHNIPIPALQVTSVTFGGPNYDILFVTSASINIDGPQDPPCGSCFMITGLGVKGHPNINFKFNFVKMSVKVQKITEPILLGEAPHWDAHHQALYFAGILENTIHKYVLATGKHTRTKVDGRPGFLVPVEGTTDQFVIGLERNFVIIQWDGEEGTPAPVIKVITEVDQHADKNRINDGKADPRGRVFAGTLRQDDSDDSNSPARVGALFRLEGSTATKVEENIAVSNGLAWDLEQKAFYYTDSADRKIRRYDYDVETGNISNMKFIFDFEEQNLVGSPDGTTIDTDGNLWVAVFFAGAVLKIDPRSGKLLQKVPIPAAQVTSLAFGGPNYDILFVTTASINIDSPQEPPCGSTFMVTGLGVKGHPNKNFKLMSEKVQKITEPVLLGEGPHWDAHHQALYFFKFVIVQWDGGEGTLAPVIKHITEVDQHAHKNRINDGKADPRGRVFAGTMRHEDPAEADNRLPAREGSLFRVEGSTVTKVEEHIGISNGLAWDLRQRAFYYTDSVDRKIRRYDYDVDTGHISNMKYIFDFDKHNIPGIPDGSTIDTDGNLWVAVFNGSAVLKIDPRSGELLHNIPIPALQVTSVTFGGPNYDILFVTSASVNIFNNNDPLEPPSGSCFALTGLGVKGYPNLNFKL